MVPAGSPTKKASTTSPKKKLSRKVVEEINRMETSDPEKEETNKDTDKAVSQVGTTLEEGRERHVTSYLRQWTQLIRLHVGGGF